jgi:hypothetical protein
LWSSQRQANDYRFPYRKTVWWIFQIGHLEQVLSRKWRVQLCRMDGRGGWNSTRPEIFVLRNSLQEWNLVEMIDKIAMEMQPIIHKIATKVKVDDELQRYVQDVKETIKILSYVNHNQNHQV